MTKTNERNEMIASTNEEAVVDDRLLRFAEALTAAGAQPALRIEIPAPSQSACVRSTHGLRLLINWATTVARPGLVEVTGGVVALLADISLVLIEEEQHMGRVIIGMDPHKRSATIEVINDCEQVLAQGRACVLRVSGRG